MVIYTLTKVATLTAVLRHIISRLFAMTMRCPILAILVAILTILRQKKNIANTGFLELTLLTVDFPIWEKYIDIFKVRLP